jgi:hypothetical protein
MDIQDYVNAGIIGPGNVEANCVDWDDMYATARAENGAFQKALSEYLDTSISCCLSFNGPEKAVLDTYFSESNEVIKNFMITRAIFFNSLICPADKLTGLQTIGVMQRSISHNPGASYIPGKGGDIAVNGSTIYVPIDYTGKTNYDPQFYTDFIEAHDALMCYVRQTISLFSGATVTGTEDDIATPYNGSC